MSSLLEMVNMSYCNCAMSMGNVTWHQSHLELHLEPSFPGLRDLTTSWLSTSWVLCLLRGALNYLYYAKSRQKYNWDMSFVPLLCPKSARFDKIDGAFFAHRKSGIKRRFSSLHPALTLMSSTDCIYKIIIMKNYRSRFLSTRLWSSERDQLCHWFSGAFIASHPVMS